jgi:hypothetical protein
MVRTLGFAAVLLVAPLIGSPAVATEVCTVGDRTTEEVIPGVTLTWDASFLCADASGEGSYRFTVTVSNAAGSDEAVTIRDLKLTHTTPRPGGRGPESTGKADVLPITVRPGGSSGFTVTGRYELTGTDQGKKANLHFRARGAGVQTREPFALGINARFRAPGAEAERDGTETGARRGREAAPPGPPSWVPGPPPWAEARSSSGPGSIRSTLRSGWPAILTPAVGSAPGG